MDLRQMEYFLAVVDHGGVNRAAAALRVAQPSLSQAVRKLEKDLGTELFHRVGRGLVVAPAGQALVGPARMILRETEAAENAVRSVGQGLGGRIDIATLSDMSTDPLSSWVARFRSEVPDARFRIEERDEAADVVDLVRSGACEIGFLAMPVAAGELASEEMSDQNFVLVCPPGTDASWPDPTPVEALAGVPFVMGERGTATRDYIENTLRRHGIEPRIVVEVPQRGAVLPMVLSGGGAAIIPLRIALDARHRGGVVRELSPALSRPLGMVHRASRLTAITTEFVEFSTRSLQSWLRGIERNTSRGHSLVEAASLTALAADHRVRDRNYRDSEVRPATDS
ncbi:LysR family transcriptional regulator [Rhodococcus jostii]|uniref:DNA-binding transcriptional regulator, LysR family n=1 Tax=Rhodococcus jostii TaxID=132919 RepID=A0A1H5D6A4_RHOJO|nr:LysR family transcriptional regulator [Rhodococcus jostii]SED74377.1 DNA-binding transcriptional regulator, LysR family [Rhodococcus jostii]